MYQLVEQHVEKRVGTDGGSADRRLIVNDDVTTLLHGAPFQVAVVQQKIPNAHLSSEFKGALDGAG